MLVARSQGGNGKDGKARQGTNICFANSVQMLAKIICCFKTVGRSSYITVSIPEFDTLRNLNKALF